MTPNGFAVQDMSIDRVVEQEIGVRPAFTFLTGLTPECLEQNRAWLEPRALVPGTTDLAFCFQSYVVKTPHHTLLIDSCIGNLKSRPGRGSWDMKRDDHYVNALARAHVTFADIDFVLCTHLHADHVGWNTRLDNGRWVPTFPNARYLMSGTEVAAWSAQHAAKPVQHFTDSVLPVIEQGRADLVDLAAGTHALNDHVRLMPTPGHTAGHYAVGLGRGSDAAVMTGDLIHSPLQMRYPSLCATVDADHALATTTRRAFLERYCDTVTLCCTAHFPAPSVGRIVRRDEGFDFAFQDH